MPTTTLFSNRIPLSNITSFQDVSAPPQQSPLFKKQVSQVSAGVQDFCLQHDPFHSMSDSYYCPELENVNVFAFFEDLDNFSVYRRGGQTLSVASRSVSRSSFKLEDELEVKASCSSTELDVERTPKRERPVIPPALKASLGIVITPPTPTKRYSGYQQKRISSTPWISDDDWNASGDAVYDSDATSVDVFDWNPPGDGVFEFQLGDVYGGIMMDFHDDPMCRP